jgi:hypothetical protein
VSDLLAHTELYRSKLSEVLEQRAVLQQQLMQVGGAGEVWAGWCCWSGGLGWSGWSSASRLLGSMVNGSLIWR